MLILLVPPISAARLSCISEMVWQFSSHFKLWIFCLASWELCLKSFLSYLVVKTLMMRDSGILEVEWKKLNLLNHFIFSFTSNVYRMILWHLSCRCPKITDKSLKYISAGLNNHKSLQQFYFYFSELTNRWKNLFIIVLAVIKSMMKELWIFRLHWAIFIILKILLSYFCRKIFELFHVK